MCAFGAHTFKEISRAQMASAAKFFKAGCIQKADKHQLVVPLASVFLNEGIVMIRDGADIEHLVRNDVSKVKTF